MLLPLSIEYFFLGLALASQANMAQDLTALLTSLSMSQQTDKISYAKLLRNNAADKVMI